MHFLWQLTSAVRCRQQAILVWMDINKYISFYLSFLCERYSSEFQASPEAETCNIFSYIPWWSKVFRQTGQGKSFEPHHMIMVLLVLPKLILQTLHAQPPSGARCLIFGQTLHLFLYLMCLNSEGFGETVRMCRLTLAFAGPLCDEYHHLMSWLISSIHCLPFLLHLLDACKCKGNKSCRWTA